MHTQNWYTECCHGCKQYKSHRDWNGSGKFHGSFTSRSLLFSILFKASYMKRTRRVSFYPICEASGCLTFSNKDMNIGKCGVKTHGWHDSVNGTDFICFLSCITQLQTTNTTKSFWEDWTVARNFGNKFHRCEWIFAVLILSHINALEEYLTKSLSLSKLYVPQKFTEMLSKFCSGQEFVEKLGILANFVIKCLHYFCTIL